MFSNQYIKQRIQKGESLRALGKNPYSNTLERSIKNAMFLDKYKHLAQTEAQRDESVEESIVGRVKLERWMGKASFIKVEDSSGVLQVYFSKNELDTHFEMLKKHLEVGDIVYASGFPFLTKTGELSLHATKIEILTKSIVPLPEKFHGLSDVELRYRQRYLDLIVNPDVRQTFVMRSLIISHIRKFFESKGFLEVETPMLHPIPGGANARPFVTYHNALDIERYLRIAPELYLKRLIVGGFEAIFEINRNFRNEGMDHSHNPEFSMIEFYWAYKTYQDLITLTQELLSYLIDALDLPTQIPHGDDVIDFSQVSILTYKQALIEIGQIDASIVQDPTKLRDFLVAHHLPVTPQMSYGHLQSEAFDAFVEHKLINPTFITEYPIEISPLARRNDIDTTLADRFELFIGGKEIGNGFSELNDPLDQYERFKEQVKARDAGDEEAQYMDEDYVWALAHGMPPTAGQGIGIDRLVMLLTNNKSIKDVILFPAMKPSKMQFKPMEDSDEL
ncbi:lysine--tRNA ligase [Helicobacter enhydrae]|uniref:Lysine--tRNA ligase n=1 Tax=Helicobacter enhydrae TaxID=222136 RepID=A0A1B1U760_9HELI|nr:lysine--tRNA ligase [Helicobacter enhydrae]ANV98613.1 lysine--tRNA ligase [Helicobacter enhydrae]